MLDVAIRKNFYSDMDNLLMRCKFKIFVYFIFKNKVPDKLKSGNSFYYVAFENLLNRIIKHGRGKNKIVAEKRDVHLNLELMAEYKKLCATGIHKYTANTVRNKTSFKLKNKKDNINGLQIVDLILSVLARKYLGKPEKPQGNNISLKVVESKVVEVTLVPGKS